jgi:hypothetical protein
MLDSRLKRRCNPPATAVIRVVVKDQLYAAIHSANCPFMVEAGMMPAIIAHAGVNSPLYDDNLRLVVPFLSEKKIDSYAESA